RFEFDFDSDSSDEAHCSGYAFNEEEAAEEWDYFAERQARYCMTEESDSEEESRPSKPLDVRCKDLPPNFRPQSSIDFLQSTVAKNLTSDLRHYIHTLRRIQQYMIPLVLNVNKLVELKEI
ncbi:hypothetical protein OSTOST_23305, partial [Ostertagia ostertagi]